MTRPGPVALPLAIAGAALALWRKTRRRNPMIENAAATDTDGWAVVGTVTDDDLAEERRRRWATPQGPERGYPVTPPRSDIPSGTWRPGWWRAEQDVLDDLADLTARHGDPWSAARRLFTTEPR